MEFVLEVLLVQVLQCFDIVDVGIVYWVGKFVNYVQIVWVGMVF